LKAATIRRKTSVVELIGQGVDELLEREMEPSSDEIVKRAIQAAGSFRSSKRDVASRHYDYLEEACSE
jgi:hypothetical protein